IRAGATLRRMVHRRTDARIGGCRRCDGPGRAWPRALLLPTFARLSKRARAGPDGRKGLAAAPDERHELPRSQLFKLVGVSGGEPAGRFGIHHAAVGGAEFAVRALAPARGEDRPGRSWPLG